MNNKHLGLMYAALGMGVLLFILKAGAWWWTNSNAILTDALESIINIVAGGFALFSLSLALKPNDFNHPNGHGKIEFISAGFEGALILVAGFFIIGKSIFDIFSPHEVQSLTLGAIITGLSGLANYLMGVVLEKRGKKYHFITMEASGEHLKSDAYSSIGLIIGLVVVLLTDWVFLDNILAVIFGIIIIVTGYKLVRRSFAGIMDETDEELLEELANDLEENRRDDWIDVHNLRLIKYGANLHLDCHLTLPWNYDTRQSHDEMKKFEDVMKELGGNRVEMFVHVDPCEPDSCQICQKKDCPVRQFESERRITWTVENLTTNRKHNH